MDTNEHRWGRDGIIRKTGSWKNEKDANYANDREFFGHG
jgi:hypothetical protein